MVRLIATLGLLTLAGCGGWKFPPDCDVYGPIEGTRTQGAEIICYFERDI